jgi:hypothetical protein
LQGFDRGPKFAADGGKGCGDDLPIQRAIMKDASAVTPSTQFSPPLAPGSGIASSALCSGRVMRRCTDKTNGK